jgi:hypothetical protein
MKSNLPTRETTGLLHSNEKKGESSSKQSKRKRHPNSMQVSPKQSPRMGGRMSPKEKRMSTDGSLPRKASYNEER